MDILADKKMMIVEAAKKRFAHFGFLKVTMDEIATDVEMGKASLYYYFQTKEDLFRAVIASEMDHLQADIGKLFLKKNSASQKLLEYTELRMKFFQDLINLGTLSVHSYLSTKSIFKKTFLDFAQVELGFIKKIFDEGKSTHEFDPDLSGDAAKVFLHILQGLRCNVLRWVKGHNIDDKTRKNLQKEMMLAAKIFIQGIKIEQ